MDPTAQLGFLGSIPGLDTMTFGVQHMDPLYVSASWILLGCADLTEGSSSSTWILSGISMRNLLASQPDLPRMRILSLNGRLWTSHRGDLIVGSLHHTIVSRVHRGYAYDH